MQQVEHNAEERGLAGTVVAQQTDDIAAVYFVSVDVKGRLVAKMLR